MGSYWAISNQFCVSLEVLDYFRGMLGWYGVGFGVWFGCCKYAKNTVKYGKDCLLGEFAGVSLEVLLDYLRRMLGWYGVGFGG